MGVAGLEGTAGEREDRFLELVERFREMKGSRHLLGHILKHLLGQILEPG